MYFIYYWTGKAKRILVYLGWDKDRFSILWAQLCLI